MPEPLDPDAVERVLRRASDLAGPPPDEATTAGIEPAAIIAAATEVGIPERAVRRSLAIERLGPQSPAARFDTLVGAAEIRGQRTVGSPPEEVLELLDRWLVAGHLLRRDRRRPDEMEWSRRDDVVGGVTRAVRGLAGEGRLGHVRRVHARVSAVDATETVVRVTIDRSAHRRATLVGGSTLGAGAVTVGLVGLVLTAPIAFAAIPAGVAGGVVLSAGRSQARRFARELGVVLDAVEERRPPEGLVSAIRRRFGRRAR